MLLISPSSTFSVAASVLLSLFKQLQHVFIKLFVTKLLFSSFQKLPCLIQTLVSALRQMYSKISQLFAKFTRFSKFFGIFLNPKNHLNSFKSSSNSFEIQKFVQNSLFRKLTLSLLIPASSLTMRRVIFSLLLIHSRKPVSFSNN